MITLKGLYPFLVTKKILHITPFQLVRASDLKMKRHNIQEEISTDPVLLKSAIKYEDLFKEDVWTSFCQLNSGFNNKGHFKHAELARIAKIISRHIDKAGNAELVLLDDDGEASLHYLIKPGQVIEVETPKEAEL